ncbi:hypothetical protein EHP00_2216 [Ecytonucleospora hepatopenaei]|uniref:Uncharacterized protein n=1 Tax=Ecytonucleospora hepatopenaei TaxID=646526 RepID=A0A1W0E4W6_9MICR|nr:hypothetical protein EHP00_2216 [Ecytonucleospora hepatopenaei]
MLLDLQCLINKLLYHYYTIIGVIQRDINNDNLEETIAIMLKELKQTKEEIDKILERYIDNTTNTNTNLYNNLYNTDNNINNIIYNTDEYINISKEFITQILEEI